MLNEKIDIIVTNVVVTIGVKYIIPKGVFEVSWSCTYDELQLHNKKLNNVLYFPYSSVNIISAI